MNRCYKAINISNLFITFKYVKYYHLGRMLTSTSQTNLRIKIMNKDSNFKNKMIILIINQEQDIINKYHLNTQKFEHITLNLKGKKN